MKRYYYVKLCMNRMHSYIGLPLDLMKDFLILSMWLKLQFGWGNPFIIVPIFVCLILVMVVIGHYEIKHKLAHLEISVMNSINPELQKILNNTTGDKN